MTPFIKVCHRNGHVFLRMVHMFMGRRTSHVIKMTPEVANKIADELRGKIKKPILKVRRA